MFLGWNLVETEARINLNPPRAFGHFKRSEKSHRSNNKTAEAMRFLPLVEMALTRG